MRVRQRIAQVRPVFDDDLNAETRNDLKPCDPAAGHFLRQCQEVAGGCGRGQADHRGRPVLRLREQLQNGAGHDAEGALRADEEILEIIARVVLAQTPQAVPDAPVGQDNFQAEHQVPGVAIGKHRGAAGVRAYVAADLAGAFRADTHRIEAVRLVSCVLHGLQHAAGVDGDGVVVGVDIAHRVETAERQHHFVAGFEGYLRADQPGVAALWNDGRAGFVGESQDLRDFVDAARPQHHRRLAEILVAPFDKIGLHLIAAANGVAGTDDLRQAVERLHGWHFVLCHNLIHVPQISIASCADLIRASVSLTHPTGDCRVKPGNDESRQWLPFTPAARRHDAGGR